MPFAAAPVPQPAAPLPTVPVAAPAFSAGSVISRSFSVWFANFVPFSIVTLVVYVPVLVLAAMMPEEGGPAWNLGDRVLSGLAQLVVTGALTYGVLESLRGGRASVGALFRTGFGKMGWVFAVSFRVGLWLILGTLLLVVPGVMWYCALFVAIPVVVVERHLDSSADALQRSRDLTKGSRRAIFVVVLVSWIVTFVVAAAAGLVAAFAQALPQPVPIVFATALIALVSTFGACAAAVAYHDLRIAKEGAATEDLVKVFE
jgi:type III secretory pathway component EscS